ncbi:MAG: histidyl-tRNA synthetase [Bacillota bacterium]|nr:MAG: histidyl-tRNA synthetase [Bacillota bacterium]
MLTTSPRGTQDILPGQSYKFQYVEDTFRDLCRRFGYQEIRTPVFEHTELFQRGVGEATDIVQKEMYTFSDRSNRSLTLKAEGTAPAARAFVEHNMQALTQPIKLFYITPVFRYERPQAGRYRQHEQCGVELFGTLSPQGDAEVIILADSFYRQLGLSHYELFINSVGCPTCRATHGEALRQALGEVLTDLCTDCRARYDRNPMRILDCKNERCQELTVNAPTVRAHLCPECEGHYAQVKQTLSDSSISYKENPRLVRGLDYYTHTAFEFISTGIGAQSAIGGGGRYNGLIETVGGQPTPGVGFGLGVERILLAIEMEGVKIPEPQPLDVFVAALGATASQAGFSLVQKLRRAGLSAEKDLLDRSLKAQLKFAGKLNAKRVIILGEDELTRGIAAVKDMASGEQQEIALADLEQALRK